MQNLCIFLSKKQKHAVKSKTRVTVNFHQSCFKNPNELRNLPSPPLNHAPNTSKFLNKTVKVLCIVKVINF